MDWVSELRPELMGWIITEIATLGLSVGWGKLVNDEEIQAKIKQDKTALHPNLKRVIEQYADEIDWDNPYIQLFLRSDETIKIVSQLWRSTSPRKTPEEIKAEFTTQFAYELEVPESRVKHTVDHLFESIVKEHENYLNEKIDSDLTASILDATANKRHIELNEKFSNLGERVDQMISQKENLIHTSHLPESQIALTSEYRSQLAQAKQFLDDLKPKRCLEQLEILHKRGWDKLTTEDRYHILTYKAFARLQMGEHGIETSQLLIDALTLNPASAKAQANAALGYLICGDIEECRELAERAIQNDPTLVFAYAMQAWGYSQESSIDDIIQKIPKAYHKNKDVAAAFGNIALKQKQYDQAEKWLRETVTTYKNSHPDVEGRLATMLIAGLWEQEDTSTIKGLKTFSLTKLNEIDELYSSALAKIKGSELEPYRIEWLFNRATVYMWLEDFDQADKDLEVAQRFAPDDLSITQNRAIIAFRRNDFTPASKFLEQLISNPEYENEAKFWLMLIAFELDDFKDSEQKAQQIINSSRSSSSFDRWWEAQQILVFSQLQMQKIDQATIHADRLVSLYPKHPLAFMIQSYVARFQGNNEKAKSNLQQLLPMLSKETPFDLKGVISQELVQVGMYSEAVNILEEIADRSLYSPITHQLVYCYYRSGELQQALQLCQSLRANSGYHHFLSNIEILIYEETLDSEPIKKVAIGHLEQHPNDLDIRLSLVWNQYRLKEFELVDSFLDNEIDFSELPFDHCNRYVWLLMERNFLRKAVQVAYAVRKQFFSNPNAHMLYVTGVFFRLDKSIPPEWYQHEKVELDTAVQICDVEDNSNPKWFIITNESNTSLEAGVLPQNHPLASQLLGKKVNDEVGESNHPFARKFKVLEIKSKYVYALHESMQSFQTHFPNETGLMMFKVRHSDDEQIDAEKTFQPLFEMQRMRNDDLQAVLEEYQKHTLPFVSLSNLAGRNFIETFGILINAKEFGILCCSGTPQETQNAVALANSKSSLMLDATAIIAVHQLGLESVITNSYKELFVVLTTVDFFKVLSQQLPAYPIIKIDDPKKGRLFVFDDENQLRFNHDSLQRMIEWIESNCEILPATGRLLENRQEQIELGKALGDCFLDTILAAREQSIILYSDDHLLRSLAQQQHEVEGVWSQIILERLLRDGAISSEFHELAVVELANLNYRHTAINAKILLRAARLANWNQAYPLNRVWVILNSTQSSINSALPVAVEFVYLLWTENLLWHQYENLVMGILTVITSSATIADQHFLLKKFEEMLSKKLRLVPTAVNQLKAIVASWGRANLY